MHVIKYVIVDSDDMMKSHGMPFQDPQSPVLEWL